MNPLIRETALSSPAGGCPFSNNLLGSDDDPLEDVDPGMVNDKSEGTFSMIANEVDVSAGCL